MSWGCESFPSLEAVSIAKLCPMEWTTSPVKFRGCGDGKVCVCMSSGTDCQSCPKVEAVRMAKCVCVSSGTLTLYSCPNIRLQIHDCEHFVPRGCENGKVCVWTVEQPTSYTKAFVPKSQSMDSQVRAAELAGSPAYTQGLKGLGGDCNCKTVCVLHSES